VNDIGYESVLGIGQLDFSSAPSGHGTLVYRKASASEMVMLQWVDSNGTKEPLRHKPGRYDSPSLSLDGKRIALQVQAGDIWAYDLLRDTMTRLTFGGVVYDHPIWSPDGQYVVCASYGKGMFQARSDGAGPAASTLTELKDSKTYQIPWSFTPDGKRLAYYETGIENPQIWTVPLEDQGGQLKAGKPERFLTSGFDEHAPSFSPDGHWLAYASTESGKFEVYVRAFPPPSSGQGSKLQMSNSGGDAPRFSRNGHDLLYQSGDQIMAVSYTLKRDKFVAEKPRVWIAKLGGALVSSSTWDVAPDGKRVIVLTPVEPAEASKQEHEVVFLLNFFDELRRRVPASK
jgi:serine/threonine-protein kinase